MEFDLYRADNGTPYYVNHEEGFTTWEHPLVTRLLEELSTPRLNEIKYAAYRAAAKLHSVQATTNLHMVHVKDLTDTGYDGEIITVPHLYDLVTSLFEDVAFETKQESIELCVNWILKCYDSGHTGILDAGTVKIGLGILCSGTPDDKYNFLFKQACNGGNEMRLEEATQLARQLLMVPATVSEKRAFSSNLAEETAQSCFTASGKENGETVTLQEFTLWMNKEPQTLVWIPTLHRMLAAATVKHEAKCAVCKIYPIVGFRYRCKKCFNTDLCQSCFWTQKTTRTHKVVHPTKEYCLLTSSGDDLRDFASQLRNKITRRYRRNTPKKNYLSISANTECKTKRIPAYAQLHTRTVALTQRLNELEAVERMSDLERDVEEVSRQEDLQPHVTPLEQTDRPLEPALPDDGDREQEAVHLQHYHYVDSMPSRSLLTGGGDEERQLQDLTNQLMTGFYELETEAIDRGSECDGLLRATFHIHKALSNLVDTVQNAID